MIVSFFLNSNSLHQPGKLKKEKRKKFRQKKKKEPILNF